MNPRKVYAADPGLVQVFSFRSGNFGPLFENLIYTDLRRSGCEIAYHITRNGNEVDFVARFPDGRARMYQAAFDISDAATLEREKRALREAQEELAIGGKLVTQENYFAEFLQEIRAPVQPSREDGDRGSLQAKIE